MDNIKRCTDHWSIGYDASLSRRRDEFDSRMIRQHKWSGSSAGRATD